ncbi:MAG: hypothetical protein K8T25_15205 [Planctomycetia bacterium]|nr:hypothetical protein [Planctomycetia bacterium]
MNLLWGFALLAVASSQGCKRNHPPAPAAPAGGGPRVATITDFDTVAPARRVDRNAIRKFSKSDLVALASGVDSYCQAVKAAGGNCSVTVDLSYCDINDTDIADLAFPQETKMIDLSYTVTGDEGTASLVGLTGLRLLQISSTKVTDRCLDSLRKMPHLMSVDVRNTSVSQENMTSLSNVLTAHAAADEPPRGGGTDSVASADKAFDAAKRQSMQQAAAEVDKYAAAVAKFGGSVRLELDFSHLPITDADVQGLTLNLPKSVTALDLSFTGVTDKSLAHLRQLPGLEQIGLAKTQITEEGVKILLQMPDLCDANLEGTGISFASRMELIRGLLPHQHIKLKRPPLPPGTEPPALPGPNAPPP